jgi:hypothetical protein
MPKINLCKVCCGGSDPKKEEMRKSRQKKRDPMIAKKQNRIMRKVVCDQWFWILIACPWMFIGAVGDFAFPDLIGRLVNSMRDYDENEFKRNMIIWCVIIVIGAVGTALN